jgi:hypothetical protein
MNFKLVSPEVLLDVHELDATTTPSGFGVGLVVASAELSAGDVPQLAHARWPNDV